MKDIEFELKNKTGVYCIFNIVNGKRYIGSSVDIYNRLHEHIHNLKHNKSHNKHLQAAWNKYGEKAFKLEILEYCDEINRFQREQYYLDFMQPEYNFAPYVTAFFDRTMDLDTRKRISDTLKKKYLSGELVGKYYGKNQVRCYIYNIKTWTLAAECSTLREAIHLLYVNWPKPSSVGVSYILKALIRNTYIVSRDAFTSVVELKNYYYKNYCVLRMSKGKYLKTVDINGIVRYYKTYTECGAYNNYKDYKIRLNAPNETICTNGTRCIILNEYQDIIETAVSIEKSMELLSGKIGEDCDVNTEISSEITQGSETL